MSASDNTASTKERPARPQPQLPRATSIHWPTWLTWLFSGLASAVGIAWLANELQAHFAPWLLFPVLVGGSLGLALVGWGRIVSQGHRRAALWSTLPLVATIVVAQHYFGYLDWQTQAARQDEAFVRAQLTFGQIDPAHLPERPASWPTFLQYQARHGRPIAASYVALGGWVWFSWLVDGLLSWLAVVAVVGWAWRRPFCPHCRSWFRPTRTGQVNAYVAADLFSICGLRGRGFDNRDSFWYRLSHCRRGCEPTLLDLAWRRVRTSAQESPHGHICLSLDRGQRDRVVGCLDQATAEISASASS